VSWLADRVCFHREAPGASRGDLLHAARAIHGPASLAGPPPGIQPGLPGLVPDPIQAHGASRVDCGSKDIPFTITSGLAQQPAAPSLSRGAFIGACHDDCRAPNPIQAHGASRVDCFTRRGPSMAPLRLPGLRPEFNPAFQASSPTQYKPTALAVWTAGRRTSRSPSRAGSPNSPPSPRYREGLLLVFATTIAASPTQYKPTAIAVWTAGGRTSRSPSRAGSPNSPPSPRYREGLLLVVATTIAAHPTQYKPTALAVWTAGGRISRWLFF